ncbi:MAG TPA: penicillin-binding transpeptidase domain-containing protein [Candidatus Baltobacteraceae bacterium]|nr:penicillin-binding transpeptidase domain-containing protein [Candidatus Baltobacteraceae bacterium]
MSTHRAVGAAAVVTARATSHRTIRRRRYVEYADPGQDDVTEYDDPVIRSIAVEALGHEKGAVLAVDPTTGRILAIVNQKMAFSAALEPCSTIKPFIAVAGLQEGVITRDTMIQVGRRRYMDLTEAMAHSNNHFFETVGSELGFQRVIKYDELLGLGQRVGYDIPEEQTGSLPATPPAFGGVARMSSFGEGIRMTPFQLASLVSTLATGGAQYYLQYPRTEQAIQGFQPRLRQQLDIAPLLPDLRQGMLAAVLYGTARQSYDPYGEQALGKTGTCNDEDLGGRLGWFASYADQAHPKIVLVVLLHGRSRIISGPHASEIAGRIYRGLSERNYFADAPITRESPGPYPDPAAETKTMAGTQSSLSSVSQ